MTKKRILHLTFDMRIGGAERVIKTLADTTDTSLYEISVMCLENEIGPFGKMLQESGFQVEKLGKRAGFDVSIIGRLRRYLKQNKIDLLHCHQYSPWAYGSLAAAFLKTNVVFTEHGRFYPDRRSPKRQFINPVLLSLTDCVTAISNATERALVEFEYIPASLIEVIYNGIPPLHPEKHSGKVVREKLGINEQPVCIGTIARLDPIKNHSMMLNAFKIVTEHIDNICLLIVGDGPEMENLTSLVTSLNLGEQVIFTGYSNTPEHYLSLMDVFLLSSLSEGAAMTLLEAMSLGKPCVVTDAGGNAELILHDHNGIVVGNNDTRGFADAIIELVDNRERIDSLGQRGRERFEDAFSAEIMTQKYHQLYQRICG